MKHTKDNLYIRHPWLHPYSKPVWKIGINEYKPKPLTLRLWLVQWKVLEERDEAVDILGDIISLTNVMKTLTRANGIFVDETNSELINKIRRIENLEQDINISISWQGNAIISECKIHAKYKIIEVNRYRLSEALRIENENNAERIALYKIRKFEFITEQLEIFKQRNESAIKKRKL